MKKLFYMISAVAIAASFASCNKIEQDNNTTPVETPAVDGTTTLTISATSPQTKTYLVDNGDTKNTNWTKDDLVTLFGLEDKTVTATAKNTTGSAAATLDFVFSGWPAAITPAYLVFDGPLAKQPEGNSVVSPVYNEDGTITATVRSLQVITNKSNMSKYANLSIGKVEENAGAYNTVMKNVCGLIKFELKGDETSVEDVLIKDALGKTMTGLVKVNYNGGQPEVVGVVEPADYVQVKANITGYDNKMLKGAYYACVLPGTYSPEITINHTDGTITTLKMPEGKTVTIERSQIFDFTTIYDPTPETGEDDPVTPPAPTKTLTLTVDFSAWPFQGAAVTAKTTTDADGNDYTFVHDGENYKFTIINTVLDGSCKGFYWRSATQGIQGNDNIDKGVTGDFEVKFPAVADMKLTSVAVSVANAETNKKFIKILNTGRGTVVSDNVYKENSPKVFEIPESVVNSSYSLTSGGKNIQLLGLILTYTPAN